MKCIHVVIGDPDGDGKLHLTDVLTAAGSARVPGVFRDHHSVLDGVTRLNPDLLFVEIAMPIVDGVAITRRLRDAGHRVRCVVIGSLLTPHDIEAAFHAGARGVLAWRNIPKDGLACAHVVARGGTWLGTSS